jgi:hypothetical protein
MFDGLLQPHRGRQDEGAAAGNDDDRATVEPELLLPWTPTSTTAS